MLGHRSTYTTAILGTLLALLLAACTSRTAMEQLSYAESIVEDSPAEALATMEHIERNDFRGECDNAHYTLVLSEVLYHNYIDTLSSSTTLPMMEYYLDSQIHSERARALYQHALVVLAEGDLAEAMVSLIEAEHSLAKVDNLRLKGLVLRAKGDIYDEGCLFANALESYQQARDCFDALGLGYHSASITYDMGGTLIQLRNFEAAEEELHRALSYGIEEDDKRFTCAVLHELLDLAVYQNDYTKCRNFIDAFATYDCLLYGQSHHHAAKAMVESRYGDMNKALTMLDEAATMEDSEWADLEYARYIIYRNGGDTKQALYWNEQSKHAQDSEMLRQNLDAERREKELTRERNTIIFALIALAVAGIIIYARHRLRRKEQELAQYIESVSELQSALNSIPKDMASSVSNLYRDRFSELNELCDIYYDHSSSSRNKSLIFNKLTETIEAIKSDHQRIKELENTVNSCRNGIMQSLREGLPKLSERDMRVALYVFAGFSNRAIAIFIDSDPVSVSKMRYNIKQKIRNANIANSEQIIAALSDKN